MLALFYQIFTFANVTFMLKGLAMSVAIAVLATVISMFFGTILALHAKPAVDSLDLFHHQGK